MQFAIGSVITWVLASFFTRVIFALGIGFFTYRGIDLLITEFLDLFSIYLNQLPLYVLQLFRLSEIDRALSIIFSAFITRATINGMKMFVGLK